MGKKRSLKTGVHDGRLCVCAARTKGISSLAAAEGEGSMAACKGVALTKRRKRPLRGLLPLTLTLSPCSVLRTRGGEGMFFCCRPRPQHT